MQQNFITFLNSGKKLAGVMLCSLLVFGCASYYDDYDQYSCGSRYYGYSIPVGRYGYNSPLRIRPLGQNDFYMMDNYPRDYFNTQMWTGIGELSRLGIHSVFEVLTP